MVLPTVLIEAASDPALRPREVQILLVLATQLTDRFAPVKHAWLARRVNLARPHVVTSLRKLIGRGYLDEGPRDGSLKTYRLKVAA